MLLPKHLWRTSTTDLLVAVLGTDVLRNPYYLVQPT